MSEDRYRIEIEPSTRLGWRMQDVPCLRVYVYDTKSHHGLGIERTRRVDYDEARQIAAALIARWERDFSEVTVP